MNKISKQSLDSLFELIKSGNTRLALEVAEGQGISKFDLLLYYWNNYKIKISTDHYISMETNNNEYELDDVEYDNKFNVWWICEGGFDNCEHFYHTTNRIEALHQAINFLIQKIEQYES